jgi:hypothetical protein
MTGYGASEYGMIRVHISRFRIAKPQVPGMNHLLPSYGISPALAACWYAHEV